MNKAESGTSLTERAGRIMRDGLLIGAVALTGAYAVSALLSPEHMLVDVL